MDQLGHLIAEGLRRQGIERDKAEEVAQGVADEVQRDFARVSRESWDDYARLLAGLKYQLANGVPILALGRPRICIKAATLAKIDLSKPVTWSWAVMNNNDHVMVFAP
ncbi:MAG: hypothetical protein ACHQ01_07615 [Candidatus Limnocylindrales bacterium]